MTCGEPSQQVGAVCEKGQTGLFQDQQEIQQGWLSGCLRWGEGAQRGLKGWCRGLECQAKEPRLYPEDQGEPRRKGSEVGTTTDASPPGPVFVTSLFLLVLMGS